jgi:chemotaxis protein CheD
MDNMIIVGMADLNTAKNPFALTTLGLGSCVGVALYDAMVQVAGLAHIMLPDSTLFSNNGNAAKFADTATIRLLLQMQRLGAKKANIKAKIAGGAQMFAFNSHNDTLRIGEKNVEAVLKYLAGHNIPVVANDTGSNYGRTVTLYAEDGRFVIKTVGHGSRTL